MLFMQANFVSVDKALTTRLQVIMKSCLCCGEFIVVDLLQVTRPDVYHLIMYMFDLLIFKSNQ